ncbi:MAG: right-handed parallel beta-helix repeat-containing protein [Bacteroidales bacterium]|nr:right-handed parallel beta-helix repeat-containing protein [Bacteroidales bacterium]
MKQFLLITTILVFCAFCTETATASLYVATDGHDDNPGTKEAPLASVHKGVELLQPGDTLWIKGGRYIISERIKIPEKNTSAQNRCYMWAVPGDTVIIDGSGMHHTSQNDFKMGRCIYVNHLANYWHFKGLTLCHAEDNGMKIEGSYNIVENCVFYGNNDTGLQIGMYKDFSIEETKELPAGTPKFNPDYQFCRGNIVINCDSYNNYDARSYNGTDDGGDADGFACKLFPGPGTEFHNCRSWTNSDDGWDLYMVYHPVLIDNCWTYHNGYTPDGREAGNGNGFKLGGGGSSGGAAFDQSVGAHVVKNCVSFGNSGKGFDQNNAYEGMYLFNCVAWDNAYNYRFPTIFKYGGMYIRNCIGFNPTTLNHEFLSENKEGSVVPDTDYNSWTTLDGCNPYKEGQKVGSDKPKTRDYSSAFVSLKAEDFMTPRLSDGSLPDNGFARLTDNSVMIDIGDPIVNFEPERFMTEEQAAAAGLELETLDNITIPFNDDRPDFGAFESDGIPSTPDVPITVKATLDCLSGNASQEVVSSTEILPITFRLGGSAKQFEVCNLPEGLSYRLADDSTLTILGTPTASGTYSVVALGGNKDIVKYGVITVVAPSHILTGDWYHFQDQPDLLPEDLRNVVSMIQGTSSDKLSYINPNYMESDSTIPPGCTKGAAVLARNSGGIQWVLPTGVMKLIVNLHFTGGRYITVKWQRADGISGSFKTEKLSKGTYCNWDVLSQAGIAAGALPVTIQLLNTNSGGEIRMYDMFIRVPDEATALARPTVSSRPNGIYDILGRKINARLEDLPVGIYLIDGKKVIVK